MRCTHCECRPTILLPGDCDGLNTSCSPLNDCLIERSWSTSTLPPRHLPIRGTLIERSACASEASQRRDCFVFVPPTATSMAPPISYDLVSPADIPAAHALEIAGTCTSSLANVHHEHMAQPSHRVPRRRSCIARGVPVRIDILSVFLDRECLKYSCFKVSSGAGTRSLSRCLHLQPRWFPHSRRIHLLDPLA